MFDWLFQKLGYVPKSTIEEPPAVVPLRKSTADFARVAVTRDQIEGPADWTVNRHEFVRNFKGAAYIAISAIARRIASQEVQCFVQRVKKSGIDEEPLKETHPIRELFREVNPFHTQFDLWFYMVAWRLVTGDSYTWKIRNGFGRPVELWPLPSQWVWAIPSQTEFISKYLVRHVFYGRDTYIPSKDIIHIMEPGLGWDGSGRFYGTAPMVATDIMIDVETAMLKQLWHRFKNFAPPGLVFMPDKDIMAGGFDENYMQQIYEWVATQHSMAQHAYKPMVMPGGVDVKNVAMTPVEMDYGKSLEKALEYILAVFSTPKAAIGLAADYNRNNYGAAMQAWADGMLNPLMLHMGQHLTQDLAREFDEKIVVRFPRIDSQDLNIIRGWMDVAMRFNVLTVEEARDLFTRTGITRIPTQKPESKVEQKQLAQQQEQQAQHQAAAEAAAEANGTKVAEADQKDQPQESQKRWRYVGDRLSALADVQGGNGDG